MAQIHENGFNESSRICFSQYMKTVLTSVHEFAFPFMHTRKIEKAKKVEKMSTVYKS